MSKIKNRFHRLFLTIALLDGLCFYILVNYMEISNIPDNTVYLDNSDKIPELSYSLNLPFQTGSLLSDKVQRVILCHIKHYRKLFSRFSILCADDADFDRNIHSNDEIFQSLQLKATFELNCELQI